MSAWSTMRGIVVSAGLGVILLIADIWAESGWFIGKAEAVVGRPMTPVSVAGVARRTTRRTIRRTAVYVSALPRGCATVTISGTLLHQCGTTYYQAVGTQYVVVDLD